MTQALEWWAPRATAVGSPKISTPVENTVEKRALLKCLAQKTLIFAIFRGRKSK
jgi:hypothetical protein